MHTDQDPGPPPLDHRELNTDLSLFATDASVGSGLPLWLPAGAVIRSELEAFARDIAHRDGCLPVYSPVLAKRALFERSGHWEKFAQDMFPSMALGGEEYVLRPANCPHHAAIYAAKRHSYRDLPIRLHEMGAMFRAERSGVLSGLSRVRQINLDDTHVFCRPDQIATEVARALRSALEAHATLGLPVDHVRLSRRDASSGYLGSAGQWAQAEEALRVAAIEILAGSALPLVEAEGEAAFYGPKLDLQVRDGRGHQESIATVQLDFNQPERFDLCFTRAEGGRERVVMIHRGTVGAMDRVVATLLERYQGRLPLWLAPVQACVLPVGPEQGAAARSLAEDLASARLRVRLDEAGSLGARVRACRARRDFLIAIVGAREAERGEVQVTDVAAGYSGTVAQRSLAPLLAEAHARRKRRVAWPAASPATS